MRYDQVQALVKYLFVITAAITIIILMTWSAMSADQDRKSDRTCLTKREARAIYPKAYLTWHGNHCWTARGVSRKPEPARHTAKEIDEIQYREEAEKRLATCCWPPPDPETSLPPALRWQPMPYWWHGSSWGTMPLRGE